MELRLLFALFRRWFWLLLIGAIIGGAVGYYYSISQPSVYRSSTKIMVMQPRESLTSDLTALTDTELAETFRSLLVVKPVLEATSARIGGAVGAGQISSQLVEGTQLMVVTVQDKAPDRAALIANTLVEKLIEYNETLQAERFGASEESLQAQIAQVEGQMAALRQEEGERPEFSEEALSARKQELEADILEMNDQILQIEVEIETLGSPGAVPDESLVNGQPPIERNAELTLLELKLAAASTVYEKMLADGVYEYELQAQSDSILAIVEEINGLEVAGVDQSDSGETSLQRAERQAALRNKRAEMALLQLNLDSTNQSYQRLVYPSGTTGTESGQDSQGGANLALYQQIYSSLLSNYEAVRLARMQGTPNVVQVELAVPGGPVRPNEMSNAMLGAAIGLIIMGSIAFLIEYLDDTLKTPEDIERVLGLPVVGFVSEVPELSFSQDDGEEQVGPYVSIFPRAPMGEAFRILRTNLEFASVDDSLKTILITSAGPSEGKTTIAANLAATFSQQEKQVVLIDCDLRRPKIHKVFGVANNVGMSDVFLGRVELSEAMHHYGGNLSVVTSGSLPSNPAELLGSESMTQFLENVNEVSDVVVIDSPPSIVTDAAILSAKVDGVVLVIYPGHTHAEDARAQMEQMNRAGARLIGVVLNRIPRKRGGYYSRYGYKYHYYRYGYGQYYGEDGGSGSGMPPKKKRFGLFRSKRKKTSTKQKTA